MSRAEKLQRRARRKAKRSRKPAASTAACADCGRRVVKSEAVSTGGPEGDRYVERFYCADCGPAAARRWVAEAGRIDSAGAEVLVPPAGEEGGAA